MESEIDKDLKGIYDEGDGEDYEDDIKPLEYIQDQEELSDDPIISAKDNSASLSQSSSSGSSSST
jgi:hypothetical protein